MYVISNIRHSIRNTLQTHAFKRNFKQIQETIVMICQIKPECDETIQRKSNKNNHSKCKSLVKICLNQSIYRSILFNSTVGMRPSDVQCTSIYGWNLLGRIEPDSTTEPHSMPRADLAAYVISVSIFLRGFFGPLYFCQF